MVTKRSLVFVSFILSLFLVVGLASAFPTPTNDVRDVYEIAGNPGVFGLITGYSDSVLTNDIDMKKGLFDEDGDVIWTILSKNVSNAKIFELNTDGSFKYLANTGFHGVDYFDYIITNGTVNSSSARVFFGVNNSIISAYGDVRDVYEIAGNPGVFGLITGYSDSVLTNDIDMKKGLFDEDGDVIWTILSKNVSNAKIFELNTDGSFKYLANTGFHGVDYFKYSITDGHKSSTPVYVYFGVNNSAPVAVEDRYNIASSINTTNATGVLANDTDIDGDELEFSVTQDVKFGKLKTVGTGFSVNGSFNYTSNKTNGVDYFVYEVTDHHMPASAKCIFIIGNNTAPTANNDSYYASKKLNISASLGILANDYDNESDKLFIEIVNSTQNGSLVVNGEGSFVYTPDNGFAGTDSFIYSLSDLDKTSENVTVIIYVNTTVISNVTDDADNETTSGDNVTVNVSSEVYPLLLNFQLYNGNVLANEYNFTANSFLDLPTNYSVPTGLVAGNYTLNLSLYSSTNELLNKTILSEFEIKSTGGSGDNNGGNTGGGGGSSRRVVNNQTNSTVNVTIPTTSNTTVNNQTNSTVSEVEETQPSFFSTITGNVIGTNAGRWSLGVIAFLILVGLAYWIVAKKRKAANAPVKIVKMSAVKKKK